MNFSAMKASQGIATTKSSTNTQNGDINSPEAIEQGNIAAAATGEEIFNDSGVFVEHYEFYPPAPGLEYKDFQMYDEDLSEFDPNLDGFFADIRAAARAQTISLHHQNNYSGIVFEERHSTFRLPAMENQVLHSNRLYSEFVNGDKDTSQVSKDDGLHSRSANFPAPPLQSNDATTDSLHAWLRTPLRHEYIAYLLLRQPQPHVWMFWVALDYSYGRSDDGTYGVKALCEMMRIGTVTKAGSLGVGVYI
ncbi:uncharacterized protein RCO7_14580 [Rhynchosporium graminicola]|uniref:Uncharacterized protein n=1 Tax=Rhynchosporium graminicola TaxID=2792576 RepID=A0A1E1KQ84_9HELO|nr:uncharacterized protein RCO7_14580 [Rhynchosporium commune]